MGATRPEVQGGDRPRPADWEGFSFRHHHCGRDNRKDELALEGHLDGPSYW